ncbi:reprolysin-like metallopeptidase [Gallaecimonas sp. GXIMD4217]|uniref:reprolysin-like metallopeptidase n=1 Tax=Gallaecimonas sp. GXIMD4217 TaxID=3131927 RepID=UPI00311AE21C
MARIALLLALLSHGSWALDWQQQDGRLYADPLALRQSVLAERRLSLPLPERTLALRLEPVALMAPALAARYPDIHSFRIFEGLRPAGRLTLTKQGLSALVMDGRHHWYLQSQPDGSLSWRQQRPQEGWQEQLRRPKTAAPRRQARQDSAVRQYRLAVAASSSYTAFHGGSKADALAAIVTTLNNLSAIFERDLGIRFQLVADNDQLIFTDPASDPFNDDNDDIDVVTAVINDRIGADNYDLGHVFNTGSGGIASVGVTCSGFKAEGVSGSSNPVGRFYDIDVVAHEFGHQFAAEHSFNGQAGACAGNRVADSAFEPGSGSTIMSYAGICAEQNLQGFSDTYFHSHSIAQIRAFQAGLGCGQVMVTGNAAPSLSVPAAAVIPAQTPFALSGSGSDDNGDSLDFNWEQIDLGAVSNGVAEMVDDGTRPLFRSLVPNASAERELPMRQSLLTGQAALGEVLPSTDRVLHFRLVARDGRGGVSTGETSLQVVASAGPVAFMAPASGNVWVAGRSFTTSWQTAGSQLSPISCSQVALDLSTDNGQFFAPLLASTANDGSEEVMLPAGSASQARLRLRCLQQPFFAISDAFAITTSVDPEVPVITGQQQLAIAEDQPLSLAVTQLFISDSDTPFPDGFSLEAFDGNNYGLSGLRLTPDRDFNGTLQVPVRVFDGSHLSNLFQLRVQVTPVNDAPLAVDDSASVQAGQQLRIEPLVNDSDVDGDALTLVSFDYQGSGQLSQDGNALLYSPASGFSGNEFIDYQISDGELSAAARISLSVVAPPAQAQSGGGGGGALGWLWLLALGNLGRRTRRSHAECACYLPCCCPGCNSSP